MPIFRNFLIPLIVLLCSLPLAAQTKAEMQKESKETQREITKTKKEIGLNEAKIKENLAKLETIKADIAETEKTISETGREIGTLNSHIATLQKDIDKEEGRLKELRDKFLVAVKKVRASRTRNSELAFIFSAKSFRQSMRRLRYLREFNAWRDKQTRKIEGQIAVLKGKQTELDKTRQQKNVALNTQRQAQTRLGVQQREQDQVVATLQAHGEELRAHLAEKQKQANELNNRIAAIIAEEQRVAAEKAAAEKAARAKAAAEKAAAEKAAAEKAARLKAEQLAREKAEREAAEKAAAEKAAQAEKLAREKAEAERRAKEKAEKAKATQKAKEEAKRAKEEAEKAKREAEQAKRDAEQARKAKQETEKKEKDYATARGRNPRGSGESESAAQPAASASADNFASMKGSLPKPADGGSFRIVKPFGRQSLAGLPGVQFDNPGIDAVVGNSAKAKAVAAGKVSGVYMLPGYNTVVIIAHGNYYTVYGNLQSAAVKTGDQVKAGQSLGTLDKDPDNDSRTLIHFEVWHGRDKLDPAAWIR